MDQTAWQRRVRARLADAMVGRQRQPVAEIKRQALVRGASAWTEEHDKEQAFQTQKHLTNTFDGLVEGSVSLTEVSAEVHAGFREYKERVAKRDKTIIRADMKKRWRPLHRSAILSRSAPRFMSTMVSRCARR